MTSGFDFITEKISRLLNKSSKLVLYLDKNSTTMLKEIAKREQHEFEELATALLIQAIRSYSQATNELIQVWEALSERQQEVAALACLGYTNDEIAEKLHISTETVKTHFSKALQKFKARGRHQLRYMLRTWDFSNFER